MTDRYGAAGVHLDAADETKRRIAELVRGARTELALGPIGAFGGMVRVPDGYERPVRRLRAPRARALHRRRRDQGPRRRARRRA